MTVIEAPVSWPRTRLVPLPLDAMLKGYPAGERRQYVVRLVLPTRPSRQGEPPQRVAHVDADHGAGPRCAVQREPRSDATGAFPHSKQTPVAPPFFLSSDVQTFAVIRDGRAEMAPSVMQIH